MNKLTKKQIINAFEAPKPKQKETFISKLRPREITTMDMLAQQIFYIRKTVWAFMIALLTIAIAGVCSMNGNTERIIQSLVPFTAALAAMEINRSYAYQMVEFEMATRFSLKSVLYARMLIIGVMYGLVFCLITPILAIAFHNNILQTGIKIMIPYLITSIVCLRIERSKLGRNNTYLSAAISIAISIFIFWIGNYEIVGITKLVADWGLFFAIPLTAIAVYENYKTINLKEAFV